MTVTNTDGWWKGAIASWGYNFWAIVPRGWSDEVEIQAPTDTEAGYVSYVSACKQTGRRTL